MPDLKEIQIPPEYKRLFDKDWRECAVYGGRCCFDGNTIISMANGGFKKIEDIKNKDIVLSLEGKDEVISVDRFEAEFDPKPMLKLNINGVVTNTTYDHKYYNGEEYVPVYQLVWGIMDESQRRTLKLLCEQYGEITKHEIQGWLQDQSIKTSSESVRLSNDSSGRKDTTDTQIDSENIHFKHKKQGDSKPQEWYKDRQQTGELGVGDKKRTVTARLEHRAYKERPYPWYELQEDDRKASERVVTVSLRPPKYANKNDVRVSRKSNWTKLLWDKRFIEWKDLEATTKGIPLQENDSLGSKKKFVIVEGVFKSADVWSISTKKYHNYFANGINVSNSLKSHTVARILLIRARMDKIRVACFREFQNSISESSHQLLKDLIDLYDLHDFEVTDKSIVNKVNGSDFLFKGLHRNEQNVKSTEGIDIAWVEEAQTVSKSSIEVLTPTIRKDGSQIIYTYNRLIERDPVHERLVIEGRPNTLIINANYDIALKYGFMPEVLRLEMEDDREKRPGLYKHKWGGEPNNVEGRIYQGWEIIDEIPHEARLWRRGLDFGYSIDPSVLIDVYEYNGGYIVDEIVYQKGLSNKSIADTINNQTDQCLVIGDSAEPKSIDEIASYGVQIVGCQKGSGSVAQGIQFVADQKISITRRSTRTIQAYQNYSWKLDVRNNLHQPVPDDTIHEWSNSMDALRYAFNGAGGNSKAMEAQKQQFARNKHNIQNNSTR